MPWRDIARSAAATCNGQCIPSATWISYGRSTADNESKVCNDVLKFDLSIFIRSRVGRPRLSVKSWPANGCFNHTPSANKSQNIDLHVLQSLNLQEARITAICRLQKGSVAKPYADGERCDFRLPVTYSSKNSYIM